MMKAEDDMTVTERRLLVALAWMCEQYLSEEGMLDHQCMCAGEDAVDLLLDYGLLVPEGRGGRWTEAGLAVLGLS